MNRKVLFFDVDGTLIDDETKEVPRSAVRIIKEVQDRGHFVFINSGRVLFMLKDQMETFGIKGAAAGCGSEIVLNGEVLFNRKIDHEEGIRIRKNLLKYRLDSWLEEPEACHFSPRPWKNQKRVEDFYEYVSDYAPAIEDGFEDYSFDFSKFMITTNPHFPEKEALKQFFATIPDFDCMDRGRGAFECVPKALNKGTAVGFVLEYFGIDPADACVFGDSVNDLSMFETNVGNRILLGQHDTALEPYATMITKDVMDDGIEYAIRKLGIV